MHAVAQEERCQLSLLTDLLHFTYCIVLKLPSNNSTVAGSSRGLGLFMLITETKITIQLMKLHTQLLTRFPLCVASVHTKSLSFSLSLSLSISVSQTHTHTPLVVNQNSSSLHFGGFAAVAAFVDFVHENVTPVECPLTYTHTHTRTNININTQISSHCLKF